MEREGGIENVGSREGEVKENELGVTPTQIQNQQNAQKKQRTTTTNDDWTPLFLTHDGERVDGPAQVSRAQRGQPNLIHIKKKLQ